MPTLPSGLKVAQSYMNDVEKQLKELWDYPNPVGREQMAEKILKGDLALARKEIEKAGESGSDKNAAMADGCACLVGVSPRPWACARGC